MKIGVKLVAVISLVNLIGIGLLAGVTLIQSQREISRLADEEAQNIARESGERISKWFEGHIGTTRTMAQIMEGYQDIPVAERRDFFNMMMRQVLTANSRLLGMYANWAPEALDGLDAEYANTPGNDETGRFIPSWTMSNGQLQLNYITAFSWETVLQIPQLRMEYMLDPAVYPIELPGIGRALYANMGTPIWDKETGAFLGAAGATLVLSTIQSMVEEIKPFGDGSAMLFSSGGIVAAHSNPERLGKKIQESEQDTFGPFLDTMVEAVAKGNAASFSYQPAQSETVIQYYAVPVSIGQVPKPWTLVVAVSRNTIMAPVYRMVRISIIIGALTMLLMSAGILFVARSISRPLVYTMTVLKDLAEGDLTKEIRVSSKDEVGELARYLNFTVDKIKSLILSIRKEADLLSETGADLAANMIETAASINEITANIHSIKTQTDRQTESVKSTNVVMEQVVDTSDVLNKIKDSIDKITQATGVVILNFEAISEGVKTVTDQEADVHNAVEEQGVLWSETIRGIVDLNEITEEVKGSAQDMLRGSHEVIKESKSLERITLEIENGMQEMAVGAEQIDRAVNEVNGISVENKRQTEALMAEVSRFKVA